MSTVAELLALNEKRLELEAHVDQLTLPSKADRGDGAGHGEVLPLLVAMADARLSTDGEGWRSTRLASTRSVVRLTPAELLIDVDRATGVRAGRGRLAAVRAWSARVASSGDLAAVLRACELASGWVDTARAVLEPRRWIGIRGATCPECGAQRVVVPGHSGEEVVEPALAADTRRGIVACADADCGAVWAADQLEQLAAVLEQQTAAEVLGLP